MAKIVFNEPRFFNCISTFASGPVYEFLQYQ